MTNKYFAAKPVDELLPELKQKIQSYHKYKQRIGDVKRWQKAHNYYYGDHVADGNGTDVSIIGESGELTAYGINYYRNLIKHVLALTCAEKPAYDFIGKNTDLITSQQAKLADSIINTYLVEKRMGRHMKQAAERALVYKEAFTYTPWDTSAGRAVTTEPVMNLDGTPKLDDNGKPVRKIKYEGDPSICSKSPWEVTRDIGLTDWGKCKWVIVDDPVNKYDLAAMHPDKAEQILELTRGYDKEAYEISQVLNSNIKDDDSDIIVVRHFYHLPTEAVPSGRYTKFLTDKISLFDGAYPYADETGNNKLPVQRITPGEKFDSTDGYSDANDVLVLQQVLNILVSTIFTNQKAFGVQAVWLPDNCNLAAEQLEGMAILKGGPPGSEPKAIQLTATPGEIFKNADLVEGGMEKIMGLNAAVRGNTDKDLSGAAIGRYQSMAIQFTSNFQQSWAELQEDVGTFMLKLLQAFANTKRITMMAGKSNKGAMRSWTGKDVNQIDRLTCDLGNPAFRTIAGREGVADKLLDKGLIKDPTQYLQFMKTGNMDPMFEGPLSKLELIRKENEMLLEGKPVKALVGDSHIQHAQEHRVILDDPEIRSLADQGDQLAMQIVSNTLAHIMEHKNQQMTQDPFWFAVSGEQPPPPPMMPPGPPPPPGAGPGPEPSIMPEQEPQQPPEAPPIPPLPPGV